MKELRAFAAIAPGLEGVLLEELGELGLSAEQQPGGADLRLSIEELYALHLRARIPSRVTVRLGGSTVKSLEDLGRLVRSLPWRAYLHPAQPLDVQVTSKGSRLRRRDAVGKKVEVSVRDALRGPRLPGPRPPREPARVLVALEGDRARIAIDASGELLHRRGWRKATAKAPIRENLAAAVLRVAGWKPGEPLVDPMCGAGTFPIEAAEVAMGRPPGLERTFAFQRWPAFDEALWKKLVAKARRAKPVDLHAPIVGADREPGAVRATRSNVDRARLGGRIQVIESALADLEPPAERGLLVINPPYGERIGGRGAAEHIGAVLRDGWAGWRVALVLPPDQGRRTRLPVECVIRFRTGGIPVGVHVGEVG